MALLEQETFELWANKIFSRFDTLTHLIESNIKHPTVINGEVLLDNHDVCRLLNVSKRTLQRYRSSNTLPYQMIYHKTYYKQNDINIFINNHFNKFKKSTVV